MTESRSPDPPLSPPPIVNRPRAAVYFFERGMSNADVADLIGKGREQVRRYFLPFDDPQRTPAPVEVVALLERWSNGALTAQDWVRPPSPPAAVFRSVAEPAR